MPENLEKSNTRGRYVQSRLPPEGAICVDVGTVAHYRYEVIQRRPLAETWPLRLGQYIMVSLTLGAGGTVAYTLRRRMKLYTTGWLMNYGLCLGGPAAIAGVLHESLQKQILFGVKEECPVCMPLRASCISVVTSWLIPSFIATVTTAHVARMNNTYPIPRLNEPRALFTELNRLSMRHRQAYALTLLACVMIPFLLTHAEQSIVRSIPLDF